MVEALEKQLTLFATPKPFKGHIGVIQRNALQSWCALKPAEIILFGESEGTAEAAGQFGARYVPDVQCNRHGTPLVSSMFQKVQELSSSDYFCYLNADIILTRRYFEILPKLNFEKFLAVGRRTDLDIQQPLDFKDSRWEEKLLEKVRTEGRLHAETGIDYLLFTRGMFLGLPPFAIGRPYYDNWLLYWVRAQRIPLIDVTEDVCVVHQNHGYQETGAKKDGRWVGPESTENLKLAGDLDFCFTIRDADWRLSRGKLMHPKRDLPALMRWVDTFPALHKDGALFWLMRPILAFRFMLRSWVRWTKGRLA